MRLLIGGSREFSSVELVREILHYHWSTAGEGEIVTLVYGSVVGAAALACRLSVDFEHYGLETEEHQPDWARFGCLAPGINNGRMAASGIDVCLIFLSAGTLVRDSYDCLIAAVDARVPVEEFWE